MAYLGGGHGAMSPFWSDHKIFYRRLYMKRCAQQEWQNSTMFDDLLRFQISEKWANLRFPLNIQKQKVFQLQLCPWTPVIGSRSACSPCPPLPNPKYATAIIAYSVNAVILFVSQINTQKQTDGQHRWADRVIDTYAYRQTEWTRRSLLW